MIIRGKGLKDLHGLGIFLVALEMPSHFVAHVGVSVMLFT